MHHVCGGIVWTKTEYELLCDICDRNRIDVGACEPHDVAKAIREFFARRDLPEPDIRCGDVTAIRWWTSPTDESDDEDSEDWDTDLCSSQCVSCYTYPCCYRQGHDRPSRCYCLRHSGEADDLFVSWQHGANRVYRGSEMSFICVKTNVKVTIENKAYVCHVATDVVEPKIILSL